jgi:predicted GNAT superfamily acetyltransferase
MEDQLNRGDRSDRFVVRWDLDRPAAIERPPDGRSEVLTRTDDEPARPHRVGDPRVDDGTVAALVQLPPDYAELRRRGPALAEEWRNACADAFEDCFGAGMVAVAFDRASVAYVFAAGSYTLARGDA